MAFLAILTALILASASSSAEASSVQDMFAFYQTGLDSQGFSDTSARRLLQDSTVCGFDEYFCGDTDMVSDTAYDAVLAGNCYNDTVDTGSPG